MDLEHKFCSFEVKEASDSGHVVGYGSVFGNEDFGGDIVEKGAFADSLKNDGMPLMLWSHDFFAPPVGEWTKATEDDHGLLLEGNLYVGASQNVDLIHRGLKSESRKTGLSIGFIPKVVESDHENDVRRIKTVDLKEVSFVNFPMNDRARVQSAKAHHDIVNGSLPKKREFEAFLRDAGMSREQAKAVMADGWEGLRTAGRDTPDDVTDLLKSLGRRTEIIRR